MNAARDAPASSSRPRGRSDRTFAPGSFDDDRPGFFELAHDADDALAGLSDVGRAQAAQELDLLAKVLASALRQVLEDAVGHGWVGVLHRRGEHTGVRRLQDLLDRAVTE